MIISLLIVCLGGANEPIFMPSLHATSIIQGNLATNYSIKTFAKASYKN